MFSDELEKISWEETTKNHLFQNRRRCAPRIVKGTLRCKRFYGIDFAGCRPLSGDYGASQPEIYAGTLRKDNFDVRSTLYYKFLYKLVCILWL